MGFIAVDTWRDLAKDNKGKVINDKNGNPIPTADLRIRVSEGDNTETFTLDKWRKVVASRGNTFQINSEFTSAKTGQNISARSVQLVANGVADELHVIKGGGNRTTFSLKSGLAESFADVCEQTELASENWRNIKG